MADESGSRRPVRNTNTTLVATISAIVLLALIGFFIFGDWDTTTENQGTTQNTPAPTTPAPKN